MAMAMVNIGVVGVAMEHLRVEMWMTMRFLTVSVLVVFVVGVSVVVLQ
jgi:hypothetical protein